MTKILFLEDEETILEVTTEYMKMKGYEVFQAIDAVEAMEIVKNHELDLAILDIMVPKGSGFDVLEYINKNKKGVGILMLSALGDETTQLKAFNLFADDYVIKPFSPLLLLKRIEAVLRRTRDREEIKNTGGLYINDDTYEAFYNNEKLKLTLSEFMLIQSLYKEKKRVFTREQLIFKIFDETYCGNDRIIDAHIKNLRKKLPKNYIKTVTGIGYQFNSEEA